MKITEHVDARGEANFIEIGGKMFNAVYTKAGILRGGHFHPYMQYCIILQGDIEMTLKEGESERVMVKKQNELIAIPAGVPHLFKSLTDSVFLEWMEKPYEATNYEPYRTLVEAQFKR